MRHVLSFTVEDDSIIPVEVNLPDGTSQDMPLHLAQSWRELLAYRDAFVPVIAALGGAGALLGVSRAVIKANQRFPGD